ncbi:MAG: N-acetyl-gamma-glutamyl-phosphate reductase, partial [Myxococcales bacterium]|nr:N-acetyl-gamma-glutamyl-phosphate reductase [Myxococcales bacterium]
ADAVYGLPELFRARLRGARLVAAPGCFATATELGLLPLARAGLLSGTVRTLAITGSSGSGAAPQAGTHHPVRAQNLKTYKPLSHQHVPEILEALTHAGARDLALDFVPVSAPLTRGIFASSFVSVAADTSEADLTEAYRAAFANEPFVRVPLGRLPEVAAVSGSNYAEVGFTLGPARGEHRTVMCFSAIDNLIKGGAGQAIQAMNLVLGLDEGATLRDPGGYP